MDKDVKRARKQKRKYVSKYDHNNFDSGKPMNDAMDHLNKIEGYPIKKPARLKSFPLPIRIVGYFLIGTIVAGIIMGIVLNFI